MKALINGKEVDLTEMAFVFYEDLLWTKRELLPSGARKVHKELFGCTLEIKCTDEGLILNLWHRGECVATFRATAQELVDDLCH